MRHCTVITVTVTVTGNLLNTKALTLVSLWNGESPCAALSSSGECIWYTTIFPGPPGALCTQQELMCVCVCIYICVCVCVCVWSANKYEGYERMCVPSYIANKSCTKFRTEIVLACKRCEMLSNPFIHWTTWLITASFLSSSYTRSTPTHTHTHIHTHTHKYIPDRLIAMSLCDNNFVSLHAAETQSALACKRCEMHCKACMHKCFLWCVCIYMYVYEFMYVFTYKYALRMYILYIYIYVCVCVYIHTYICIHIDMYVNIYIYIYIYIYIHVYILRCV